MQIRGTTQLQSTSQLDLVNQTRQAESPTGSVTLDTTDQIEISSEARMLSGMDGVSSSRAERIETIRQQIATGEYETADKLELAVDRLLDELA